MESPGRPCSANMGLFQISGTLYFGGEYGVALFGTLLEGTLLEGTLLVG